MLTSKLNFEAQVKDKSEKANLGLNLAWRGIFNNAKVDFPAKCKWFKACERAVLCHGAQVWDYRHITM